MGRARLGLGLWPNSGDQGHLGSPPQPPEPFSAGEDRIKHLLVWHSARSLELTKGLGISYSKCLTKILEINSDENTLKKRQLHIKLKMSDFHPGWILVSTGDPF